MVPMIVRGPGIRAGVRTDQPVSTLDLAPTFLEAAGLAYSTIDVDGDERLKERFGEVVPVLLRDGRPVAKVRVDAVRLRRLVRRRR